jgi:hypothetical protein
MKALSSLETSEVFGGWKLFKKKVKVTKSSTSSSSSSSSSSNSDSSSDSNGISAEEAKKLCEKVGAASDQTPYKNIPIAEICSGAVENQKKLVNKTADYLESICL